MPRASEPWFPRFADIPGVQWQTPSNVDPSKLAGYGARPEVENYGGEDSYWWPSLDPEDAGDSEARTSQSPASQHGSLDYHETYTVEQILRVLAEALELPGAPSDYHFLIAGASERMWKRRMEEPRGIREMERLCRLDMELVRAYPKILTRWSGVDEDEPMVLHMTCCDSLFRLYVEEGYIHEAEVIARQAVEEFRQERFVEGQLATIRQRLALLEAEDA